MSIDEKSIKKEIKNLIKDAKKKKDTLSLIIGLYFAYLVKDKKQIKELEKLKSFKEISEKVEIIKAAAQEREISKLSAVSEEIKKIIEKAANLEIDEEFENLFNKIPSIIFKSEIAKTFLNRLLEQGEVEKALQYLNKVDKVEDPEIEYLMGRAYEEKSITNLAKTYLEKSAKRGFKKAKERLATLLMKQAEFERAAHLWEECGNFSKAFDCYIAARKFKEAIKLKDKVSQEELYKLALTLLKEGKLKEVEEILKNISDEKKSLLEAAILFEKKEKDKAFLKVKDILKDLKEEEKEIALHIISEYYKENAKWKELSILLAPLETSGSLDNRKRLLLAQAYVELKDYPRALKILAELIETDQRKQAKKLIKNIKEKCENDRIQKICEEILKEDTFFKRLKEGLKKSKSSIVDGIESLLTGKSRVDFTTLEEIEEILIASDVGIQATQEIIRAIKRKMELGEIKNPAALKEALQEEIFKILKRAEGKLEITHKPFVIMVVGVNGTGKTTSIAKLGYMLKNKGYSVLFAAADTFRAAAIEQLETWGKRIGVDTIKQKPGSDPSGVVYDAIKAAKARNIDVVIIDTAGRLHTKVNLMEELKKMVRVASKELPGAPHEILLVLDAVVGQNAISQAKLFSEAVPITGIILTKLDGTAKGGIIIAIAKLFGIPIKFIGVGEKIDDLQIFDAERFVDALFES